MDVGMVGLAGSGTTTLFNALTGGHAEGYTDKAHVGVADIPDPRLITVAGYFAPKKIVHATLRLVDIPGIPPGTDARKLSAVLEQIRQVDAICLLVRCFDDGTGHVEPLRDLDEVETELVLADLVVAEGAHDKAARTARTGDTDAKARVAVLERVKAALEAERPIRAVEGWTDGDAAILRNYGFITAKPVLYVANIAEEHVGGESPYALAVAGHAEARGSQHVAVCAKLEAELAELDEADRGEMLESLGLLEPAIGALARAASATLGMETFYTAADHKEVRAWNVRAGSTAPEAAGVVHTDMQRGFIRAETYSVDDLFEHKSEKAIREAGRMRSEGKHYVVKDGDVVHFLFNV